MIDHVEVKRQGYVTSRRRTWMGERHESSTGITIDMDPAE